MCKYTEIRVWHSLKERPDSIPVEIDADSREVEILTKRLVDSGAVVKAVAKAKFGPPFDPDYQAKLEGGYTIISYNSNND